MKDSFRKGYEQVINNLGGATGAAVSQEWIDSINASIQKTSELMYQEAAKHGSLDVSRLQGFINEVWHTQTLNVNAQIHSSSSEAIMLGENGLGSVDVRVITGSGTVKDYSLKSYNTAANAVRAQSETKWERFNNNAAHSDMNVQEYMDKTGQKMDSTTKLSMYYGQGKTISTEQVTAAKQLLQKKIEALEKKPFSKETSLQLERYKEVERTLTDVVKDGKGTESLPLTHKQAIELAKAAQKGDISEELLKECGLDISKLVSAGDIVRESLKAGLSAAALSAIVSLAPVIINSVSMLIAEGEIDAEELKQGGLTAVKGSGKSFLIGSIAAALNTCCQTGKLGDAFIDVNPTMLSSLVVIAVGTVDNAVKYATGKITKGEMAREIMRMYVTTACSYAGGTILAALCEGFPLAYMLGSFIGSIVGGLLYSATENLFISFCIDSGCTFFGVVDQNYVLPQEVIEDLGIDIFEFEKLESNEFQIDVFRPELFTFNEFSYDQYGIKPLKRGLIGVFQIGYV